MIHGPCGPIDPNSMHDQWAMVKTLPKRFSKDITKIKNSYVKSTQEDVKVLITNDYEVNRWVILRVDMVVI